MRLLLVLPLLIFAAPTASAGCIEALTTQACATTGFVPKANVTSDAFVGEVDVSVESDALLVPLVAVFYGPAAALEYKHFLIPTVEGKLVFYDLSLRSTYSQICTQVPGAGGCLPFLV